ncbi:MAG: isopenicillin N synthase family oxygenase [Candidatus Sericytochromatia bacterium]|nr:isopenicillin N synthase family oxygenase [Candidatus Tanganyikabacteria bacterium]
MSAVAPSIPVVRLDDYRSGDAERRGNFVRALGEGLEHYGFVTLDGHGVDHGLIRQAYDLFAAFFALPEEVKLAYAGVEGGQRGYIPYGREHAKNNPVGDLKEFWHVGRDLPGDHLYHGHYPPNVWPREIPGLEGTMRALYGQLDACVSSLLEALADYFGLSRRTFADMVVDGNSVMRAIYYPPVTGTIPPGAVRAAAHEDINIITLLCEATSSGLELLTRDAAWLPISALEGQIVVDSGDMLQRVTNGRIPATTHRVVNPDDGHQGARYSMPFFVHPYSACDLSVLDAFVTPEQPARWAPITADAYLKERLRQIGLMRGPVM